MISETRSVRIRQAPTKRSYETTVPMLTMPRGGMLFSSGTSSATLEEIRHHRLWNYIAISAVANKVSEYFPNISYVGGPAPKDPGRQFGKARLQHAMATYGAVIQAQLPEDIKPVPDNHPLVQLFRSVNPQEWWSVFVYEMIVFKRLTGINYIWAIPNGAGRPAELWNIPPQWVDPADGMRNPKTGELLGWRVVPDGDKSREITLPPNEVIMWKSVNPESKRLPLSPLRATSEWTDSQESIEKARTLTFQQGPWPSVLVEPPDADKDWFLDDKFYAQAAERFVQRWGGIKKAGIPLVAPPGYKYKPWSMAPREMDFNESAAQVRDQLLAVHGVPKVIAGITEEVNRATSFAAREVFCRETVTPILQDLAGVLTERLAVLFDPRIRIWFDDVVPRDDEAFRADVQLRFNTGGMSPRDIATEYGQELPDDPAYDQRFISMSLVPIQFAVEPPAPATPPEPSNEDPDDPAEAVDDEVDEGDEAVDDDGGRDTGQQHVNGSRLILPSRSLWKPSANGHGGLATQAPAVLPGRSVRQRVRLSRVHLDFVRRQAAWEKRANAALKRFWSTIIEDVSGRVSHTTDVDELLPDGQFRREFNRVMEPLWAAMAADGARLEQRSIGAVSGSGAQASIDAILQAEELPDIFVDIDPQAKKRIRAYLKARAVGIWRKVSQTTKDALRRAVEKGVLSDEGIREIGRRIIDRLGLSKQNAVRIARTEATSSLNAGGQTVREAEGIKDKLWLSTSDNLTRRSPPDEFDHLEANNQSVPNDQPFIVSGEELLYPGDISLGASAGNVVNCRCSSTADV